MYHKRTRESRTGVPSNGTGACVFREKSVGLGMAFPKPSSHWSPMHAELRRIVGAPDFLDPWLDRFYEPAEIRLLRRIADADGDARDIAASLGFSADDLRRAIRRGVLDSVAENRIRPAGFHARFEIWALFEGWKDLPQEVRDSLNRWELDRYVAGNRERVASLRNGPPPDPRAVTPRYVLLDEAMEILRRVDRVYLWPCNCRSILGNCDQSVYTCVRFDNDRGLGWEISRERAMEVVREANRAGLMQSGELGLDAAGRLTGAICNCCADCCFPHRMAEALAAPGVWPKQRYIARLATKKCIRCGRCVKRCPFGAFSAERKPRDSSRDPARSGRRPPPEIRFQPDRCRGCGLCATACPAAAIEMERLDVGEEWDVWKSVGAHSGVG